MNRGDIPNELHLAYTYIGEASRRARFGEWGICGKALALAYIKIADAAKALDMNLEAEARKLRMEGNHE